MENVDMSEQLQAYIFNRTHYDGTPLGFLTLYKVTVLAHSKGEAWTYLLEQAGNGVHSDWDKPLVQLVKPGILNTVAE